MNIVRRSVLGTMIVAATLGATLAGAPAQAAPAKPASAAAGVLVRCGNGTAGYNRCVSARRTAVRQGYRIGPLRHNVADCTSPGCVPGWFFYYYP
jgi:hypothetical protein